MNNISIAEKARRQFMIEEERQKVEAFILGSMLKLLAYQLNAIGELKPPPKKTPAQIMRLAKVKLEEFLKESYAEDELQKGNSSKGIIQDTTF